MCYSVLVRRDRKLLAQRLGLSFDIVFTGDNPGIDDGATEQLYPGAQTSIFQLDSDKVQINQMRFGAFPPASLPKNTYYTTYNARRDNLTSRFWSESFCHSHGIIGIESFFEWVNVADLLKDSRISLEQVEEVFRRQTEARKKKVLEAKKKYSPTPTELKDPRERKIIIKFVPEPLGTLFLPTINSKNFENSQEEGFAIITDEPPADVSNAGHDRCPIVLSANFAVEWLQSGRSTPTKAFEILKENRPPKLTYQLPTLE
jgi:putative SOS response-associated peptidase YedK